MPRLVHKKPRDCLHKATGQAVVWIGGKAKYLGLYGSPESHVAFDEVVTEWKCSSTDPITTTNTTVNQLCLAFYRYAKAYYVRDGNPTAEVHAIKMVLKRFRRKHGELLTAHVHSSHLESTIGRMAKAGLSRSYCNQGLGRLKRMFAWGVRKRLVPGNTMHVIREAITLSAGRSDAKEPRIIQPVDDAVIEATLAHLPTVVADLVRVLRNCGARPSELFRLTRQDVDRSTTPWKYVPKRHKTEAKGKSRVILFGPKSRDILMRYLVGPADGLVFEKPSTGGQFRRWNFHQYVANAAKKAKVAHWHPYQLRHSAGTAARKEADLEAAQALLGHARRSTTERYAAPDAGRGADVAERIG